MGNEQTSNESVRIFTECTFFTAQITPYKNEHYAKVEGKSCAQLEEELRAVYTAYPEYSDPDCCGGDFDAMVVKFAADDFYKLHYVAQRYLDLTSAAVSMTAAP